MLEYLNALRAGAPNDRMFPNTSEAFEMVFSVF